MGLDQYLTAKVYVGAKYAAVKQGCLEVQESCFLEEDKQTADFKKCVVYPTSNISSIIYDIGYWRKANWIHKWFVDNVQYGNDDCGEYSISEEQLNDLDELCHDILGKFLQVVEHRLDKKELISYIKEHLCPCDGFFFGSNSLEDEDDLSYYEQSLHDTIKFISIAKKYIDKYCAGIFYRASW